MGATRLAASGAAVTTGVGAGIGVGMAAEIAAGGAISVGTLTGTTRSPDAQATAIAGINANHSKTLLLHNRPIPPLPI